MSVTIECSPSQAVVRLRDMAIKSDANLATLASVYHACKASGNWTGWTAERRSEVAALVDSQYLIDYLESLPINTDGVRTAPRNWRGFILSDGEWWPCAAMNDGKRRWVEYRVDEAPSGGYSSVERWPAWADCTADDTPCIRVDF